MNLCDKCKREYPEEQGRYDEDGDLICPNCYRENKE